MPKIFENECLIIRDLPEVFARQYNSYDDLNVLKQVWDFEQDPPVLVRTKGDDEVVLEWELRDINWFAEKHITAHYPLWKQSNLIREGGDALGVMNTFINSVQVWANQDPLPDPWDGTLQEITP